MGMLSVRLCLIFFGCLVMDFTTHSLTPPDHFVLAVMDRTKHDKAVYGCGDTIFETIHGQISSFIPARDPGFVCNLTLISPPGTRLSLTVTTLELPSRYPNTCDDGTGSRLKMLSSDVEGATPLLVSFPNGLCGNIRPNHPIESVDNYIFLQLEAVESLLDNNFMLMYTAFKTTVDGECFACDIGSNRDSPFCIDRRLQCDGRQNCPVNEETSENCMAATATPPGPNSKVTIFIVSGLTVGLIIISILIVIMICALRRVRSKRDQDDIRCSARDIHQSGVMPVDLPTNSSEPSHGLSRIYQPSAALAFTADGEYDTNGAQFAPNPALSLPVAPPPYSTLPRHMEQSLQMAENTNPISRSNQQESTDNI